MRETVLVPVDRIEVGDQNLRDLEVDDGLVELAADIASRGMLQPIGVRRLPTGAYQLLWGLRRLRAHRYLRRSAIEAVIRDEAGEDIIDVALAENLQRRQLTLEEECRAIGRMADSGLSPAQISHRVSRSRDWVLRRLAIPGMPGDVRDALLAQRISVGVAEALTLLEDEPGRSLILAHAISSGLGRAAVEQACASWRESARALAAGADPEQPGPVIYQPPVIALNCAACGALKPQEQLMIVRVCADGCASTRAAQGPVEETDGKPRRPASDRRNGARRPKP